MLNEIQQQNINSTTSQGRSLLSTGTMPQAMPGVDFLALLQSASTQSTRSELPVPEHNQTQPAPKQAHPKSEKTYSKAENPTSPKHSDAVASSSQNVTSSSTNTIDENITTASDLNQSTPETSANSSESSTQLASQSTQDQTNFVAMPVVAPQPQLVTTPLLDTITSADAFLEGSAQQGQSIIAQAEASAQSTSTAEFAQLVTKTSTSSQTESLQLTSQQPLETLTPTQQTGLLEVASPNIASEASLQSAVGPVASSEASFLASQSLSTASSGLQADAGVTNELAAHLQDASSQAKVIRDTSLQPVMTETSLVMAQEAISSQQTLAPTSLSLSDENAALQIAQSTAPVTETQTSQAVQSLNAPLSIAQLMEGLTEQATPQTLSGTQSTLTTFAPGLITASPTQIASMSSNTASSLMINPLNSSGATSRLLNPATVLAAQDLPPAPTHEQLLRQIEQAQRNGAERIRVFLEPDNLGPIDVTLEIARDKRLRLSMNSENPTVLALLQKEAPKLEISLIQAGYQTQHENWGFNLMNQHSFQQSFQQGNHPSQQNSWQKQSWTSDSIAPKASIATNYTSQNPLLGIDILT